MRESDFIVPMGIAGILAGLKGVQNREASEVERLNEIARQALETEEDDEGIPPIGDPNRGSNPDIDQSQAGEYTDDEGNQRVFGDEFQSGSTLDLIGTAADMLLSGGIFTMNNLIGSAAEKMTDGEIDEFYKGPAQDQVYGGYGFDKHRDTYDLQEGDINIYGNPVLMDSPMYDADNPYRDLFKADGGRVHLKGGGMDASKSDFGKSKKKEKDTTKNTTGGNDDTGNDKKPLGSLIQGIPNIGNLGNLFGTATPTPSVGPTPADQFGTAMKMGMMMDEEDSFGFGPSPLGMGTFDVGDFSVTVDPFGAQQLSVKGPISSIPGIGSMFGYKQ